MILILILIAFRIFHIHGFMGRRNRFDISGQLEGLAWRHRRVIFAKSATNLARPHHDNAENNSPSPERERAGVRADVPPTLNIKPA